MNLNNTIITTPDEDIYTTLSKFSHEIRNPLTLMSSELQLLEYDFPEITKYEHWNDIIRHIDYIKELLNELSNYNNSHKLRLEDVDISHFINTISSSMYPVLHYLGIQLKTECSPHLPVCRIDSIKLRQVLLNLLKNASEAVSPQTGVIIIRVFPANEKIAISIEDNGYGITTEQLNTIFMPFVTYKSSGTGLGLFIAKQIIEAHGGSIQVSSKPNQGSVFTIFLG